MKISDQKLLDAGYKKYVQILLTGADYLFQKKITDEKGVRYFIDIYVYVNVGKYWYRAEYDKARSYQPEIQFHKGKHPTMNVTLLIDDVTDIVEIEDTFENLWKSVGKPYYELYGEIEMEFTFDAEDKNGIY